MPKVGSGCKRRKNSLSLYYPKVAQEYSVMLIRVRACAVVRCGEAWHDVRQSLQWRAVPH